MCVSNHLSVKVSLIKKQKERLYACRESRDAVIWDGTHCVSDCSANLSKIFEHSRVIMSYKQTSPNWAYLTKNLSIIPKMGPHHILPIFYCFTSLWAQLGPLPCEYLGEFDSKYFIALITCLKWTKNFDNNLIIVCFLCVLSSDFT